MASGSGQPPLLQGNAEPLNSNEIRNGNDDNLTGPLAFEDANDDQQILVEHDHSQLMRRRHSKEAKKENTLNKSNGKGNMARKSPEQTPPKIGIPKIIPDPGSGSSNKSSPPSKHSQQSLECNEHATCRPLSLPIENPTSLVINNAMTPTRSTTDLPSQVGNIMRPENEAGTERELHENGQTPIYLRQQQWESNYKEAAIFLEEGENNDKFSHHPRSKDALPAYLLVHNKWFHLLDLSASLILLGLGFLEKPSIDKIKVPEQVHATIELCTLLLIAVLMGLRTRWIGLQTFIRHKRTSIKIATLSIMVIEAVVVIARADSHFRITRALRPIFVIDNHYCGGVRRFVRQILQSLPPILDMLTLVLFIMLIYSVFGFYLFSGVDPNYFSDLLRSFISLFVLLTTANYPDVMMSSYAASGWSCIFFISYLSINLYFLMNLLLAVVYDTFTTTMKEKFRRLYLHKRKAAQHAFGLLVTKEKPDLVSFQHFEGLIKQHKPSASQTEAYLTFKVLNKSGSGYLRIEEFYGIYDACTYSWDVTRVECPWYAKQEGNLKAVLGFIYNIVKSAWFEYTIYFVVFANGIILIVQTAVLDSETIEDTTIYSFWVSCFFVGFYTVEASLKLLGLGFSKYFSSYWNLFDFIVTALGIISLILGFLDVPITYIIILRPLRLITLFRMKKRFRDVFGTAVILFPRLTSAAIVLLLTYYFFGIIGMECFKNLEPKLRNCCVNTTVEEFYRYEPNSTQNAYYWLNTFNNMPEAGVTLFELTVVNNWFITMEGHAIVTGTEWSRLFFMIFYVFTMIVMTIIVAFILEAFLFRIQYKSFLTKEEEQKKFSIDVILSGAEIQNMIMHSNNMIEDPSTISSIQIGVNYKFIGRKSRTKEQLQLLMYNEEIDMWLAEASRDEAKNKALLAAAILKERQRQDSETPGMEIYGQYTRQERNSSVGQVGGVILQVVEDEDEVTTIHREVLPDLPSTAQGSSII